MPPRRPIAITTLLAAILWSSVASAAEPGDLPPENAGVDAAFAGVEQHRAYWRGSGPTRLFLAATFELGAVYLRPTAHLGYGKPHHMWAGVEAASAVSPSGLRNYVGIRGMLPIGDVRLGARYESPIDQAFLLPQEEYRTRDIDQEGLATSNYLALEAEISGAAPFPGGNLFAVATGYHLENVPDGSFVFEEALRVVTAGPWLWRGRFGYLYHVDWLNTLRAGAAAEAIHLIEREAFVFRAGPVISAALTHHMEAVGAIMIVIDSPDKLGLRGASIGQLGLRYRWATGDRFPEFP